MDKLIKPVRNTIKVAVGIVANQEGLLLVAKRPAHWLGGGFWEFPGGKLEPNEDSQTALKRELLEEVGIIVHSSTPLIELSYDYPERRVILHAWKVHAFTGQASGLEGQEICWRAPDSLNSLNMLPANRAIVVATQLPDRYFITSECVDKSIFLQNLNNVLENGDIKLVELRSKLLSQQEYLSLAVTVLELCRQKDVKLILSHPTITFSNEIDADGIYLGWEQMQKLNHRPLPKDKWVGASCQNEAQIQKAEQIGVDFAVVSPGQFSPESQHPGWENFAKLVAMANIPVFALGSMKESDIILAKQHGAQGIAATGC